MKCKSFKMHIPACSSKNALFVCQEKEVTSILSDLVKQCKVHNLLLCFSFLSGNAGAKQVNFIILNLFSSFTFSGGSYLCILIGLTMKYVMPFASNHNLSSCVYKPVYSMRRRTSFMSCACFIIHLRSSLNPFSLLFILMCSNLLLLMSTRQAIFNVALDTFTPK